MFRIKSLELIHWDYWQRVTVPLDTQIVNIVGPNGSGKTTLLDALRTLLALECSAGRNYKRYVRRSGEPFAWLRAVVDNRRVENRRNPFWPIFDDEVTLACRIRKQGGDWQRQYALAPGRIAIEALEGSAQWMGRNEYQRLLDNAGLTKAIAEVLSLEQGATDKLCEYTPKALLDLVFHVFGDKQVLDAYLEAKGHQRETERELQEKEKDLAALDNRVEKMNLRVNRFIEWRNLRQERLDLQSEVLPRLELYELMESIAGARNQIQGTRRQLREKERARDSLDSAVGDLRQALAQAREQEIRIHGERERLAAESQRARDALTRARAVLEQRDELLALARAQHGVDKAEVARRLGEERQRLAEIKHEIKGVGARQSELQALMAALGSGRQIAPEFVRELRAALDEAGIPHRMLVEIVEVLDSRWQGAVEALLAPYRHLVLLARESDRAQAYRIGERLKYRHFVSAGREALPSPQPGSVLEVVDFKAEPPGWLAQLLNRVQRVADAQEGARLPAVQDWITASGYHRERRGGRHIGVHPADYHFGAAARGRRLAALQEESAALAQRIAALESEERGLLRSITQGEALLAGVDSAQMLAARAAEFAQAEERLPELEAAVQAGTAAEAQACRAWEEAVGFQHGVEAKLKAEQARLAALAREIETLKPQAKKEREEQAKRLRYFRGERAKMPRGWLERSALEALRERYGRADAVRFRLRELEQRLSQEGWETDETVVPLRDKLREELSAMQAEVDRRRADNERARILTEAARAEYINVLRATVRRYGRNIRALGELAGIEVECDLPHLENDDLVLAQAGLNVRFNFDQKGAMGLNDGEASGGQQVMKSLILLIGLMMDESQPGGFVFIDEPFAHLDVMNIDRVGGFLKATHAQYLITTPITHNINVYDPASLTLVTFKKLPGAPWAPPIALVSRQVTQAKQAGLKSVVRHG